MELSLKAKAGIGLALFALGLATGRYTVAPASISNKTATKENQSQNTNTKTTVVETKEPDGEDKIITTIDQNTNTKTAETSTDSILTVAPSKTNISALVANDFSKGLLVPAYGVSITKQFLGPVTLGAFGLTNGVVGISLGLNF